MADHPPTQWARNPLATAIVGFTGGLLIAYAIGVWQRHVALAERDAAHGVVLGAKDVQIAEARAQVAEVQRTLAAAETRSALLRARIALLLAANDLDQRNFGIASERLKVASESMALVDASALGLDPSSVIAMRDQIAGTTITLDRDLGAQRQSVLELAARLEGLGGAR